MPSSSKRNTDREREIRTLFRIVTCNLFYAGLPKEVKTLGEQFCELLDIDGRHATETLKPSIHDPRRMSLAMLRVEADEWDRLEQTSAVERKSALVWQVTKGLAYLIEHLLERGRKVEAEKWSSWGKDLSEKAAEMERAEDEAQRYTSKQYVEENVEDVEMASD